MTRVVPGPARAYDLMSGATAAQLNALILARSYAMSPPIRLGPGVFELDAQIVLRSYVQIIGAGRGVTILRATYSPSSALADDPTNSFITSYSPVSGISTTLSSMATRGDYKITPTATPDGTWVGKYLRLLGVNTGGEEHLTSNGTLVVNCEIISIASASGASALLDGRLRTHFSAGLDVDEVSPMFDAGLSDLSVDGVDAGTLATGVELRHAIRCSVERVAFSGFTRSDIGVYGGGHDVVLKDTYRSGGSNAHIFAEAVHDLRIEGMRCNPSGDQFHPSLGYNRHLLFIRGGCDNWQIHNCEAQSAGAALYVAGTYHGRIDGLRARHCEPDTVHESLAVSGEGFAAGPACAVIQIGDSGPLDWAAVSVGIVADNLLVEECFSQSPPSSGNPSAFGIMLHDGVFAKGNNWTVSYSGKRLDKTPDPSASNPDGRNWIKGVMFQDVGGELFGINVRGVLVPLRFSGNVVPNITGLGVYESAQDPLTDPGGYLMEVSMAVPASDFSNVQGPTLTNVTIDFRDTGYAAIDGYPPSRNAKWVNATYLFRAALSTWAYNKTGGDVEAGQAVALDETASEVLAGYPQVKAATGAATEKVLVAFFGERSASASGNALNSDGDVMLWSHASEGEVGVKVRSADTIRVGDKLVVDPAVVAGLTGKDWKKDNTATAGYVVAAAAKASGARAIVQATRA